MIEVLLINFVINIPISDVYIIIEVLLNIFLNENISILKFILWIKSWIYMFDDKQFDFWGLYYDWSSIKYILP
jgi:hypothetical protein